MWTFLLGLALGGGIGWYFYFSSRREAIRLDEEKQMLVQERQIVIEFMHHMVEAIGEGVDRRELFQRVVHAAVLSTGALSACVFERTPDDKMRGVAVEGLFPPHRPLSEDARVKMVTRAKFLESVLRAEEFDISEGIVGAVARSGKGVLISDARNDPRIIKHDDPALEVKSIIVVPIAFRERSIGVLAIVNPADGLAFTETDYSLGESLGEQAGLAIHNSDLMALQIEKNRLDMDISLASSIQGLLLPQRYPDMPNIEINAFYQPAQKVGGDLYDVFELGDGRIGVAIADVSGKGIPASLLMSICQSNLRHFARMHASPSEVLSALNTVLVDEMHQNMFITIIYGVIEADAGRLVFARAGHELPLFVHGKRHEGMNRTEFLGSAGMACGLVPSEIFSETTEDRAVPFESGDLLVLYTDGVTEALNERHLQFSAERLADAVEANRNLDSKALNRAVITRVKEFAGKNAPEDDITLLTIKHV